MLNKMEFNQMIGERLSTAIETMNMTQQQVILKCAERGYEISQSNASKMFSGSSIQILQVVQVCEVLGLNLCEVLSMDPNTELHVKQEYNNKNKQIISDARNTAFRGYRGEYAIYFYTTKNEEYIHQGVFKLDEDPTTHQCVVDFSFKTGELDEAGCEIEKHYTGYAFYSIPMQTIYCEILSDEIGEKSYLLFRYHFIAYQRLECRLAVAITVSSGIRRLPTMHKFLLTRNELSPIELDYLCGQLKLNSSEIMISENAYREFLRDPQLPTKFFEYFGEKATNAERFISSVAKVPYYTFNESLISDAFIPTLDKMKIICLLRKYSSAPRCIKISDKAEEIVYKYLQFKEDETVEGS